jgi:serine/threonine protein phosphatase PrpC
MKSERRGQGAVAFSTGKSHRYYEDRYRLLTKDIPMVRQADQGEIYAVFDGMGGAPKGRDAAQELSDSLIEFYRNPEVYPFSQKGLHTLLMDANMSVFNWGMMPGTNRPLGGCAGTVVWIFDQTLFVFHAGDTAAIHIRDGQPRQLTQFHETGKLLHRYFGMGPSLQIDIVDFQLEESDRVLILSDGITKVYHPFDAVKVVEEHEDITKAAVELARRSVSRGSIDDITVLLIEIDELP